MQVATAKNIDNILAMTVPVNLTAMTLKTKKTKADTRRDEREYEEQKKEYEKRKKFVRMLERLLRKAQKHSNLSVKELKERLSDKEKIVISKFNIIGDVNELIHAIAEMIKIQEVILENQSVKKTQTLRKKRLKTKNVINRNAPGFQQLELYKNTFMTFGKVEVPNMFGGTTMIIRYDDNIF